MLCSVWKPFLDLERLYSAQIPDSLEYGGCVERLWPLGGSNGSDGSSQSALGSPSDPGSPAWARVLGGGTSAEGGAQDLSSSVVDQG